MKSAYVIDLRCSKCDQTYAADRLQTICDECNSHLLVHYDLERIREVVDRDELAGGKQRMWKWGPLLPVAKETNIVSLGEGETPVLLSNQLGKEIGIERLYIKDESQNPTGTFKARGLAAAVSKAHEFGLKDLIIPTAGNAGGALAAYAARAGLRSKIVMPKDSPVVNISESEAYGAEVQLVDGLISDAGALVDKDVEKGDWFNVATFKEPYRVEGKKIMGYELAENFDWELPEVIIYPTGGGTGLIGMWIAFQQMIELGWLRSNALPRMVVVQSSGCAPIVEAFEAGSSEGKAWPNAETIASGLRVPKSFADHHILSVLYESEGIAVSVSDETILAAQSKLGSHEGIFSAPEGAATLAAAEKLIAQKLIKADERVVLFNTGAGIKYIS